MKRLGILLIAILIAGAAVYIFGKGSLFTVQEAAQTGGDYTVVKHFTFSSPEELKGWDKKLLGQKKTEYELAEVDGVKCLKANSSDSASAFYYKQKLSWQKDPFISWDWKAIKFPDLTRKESIGEKEEFDFVAQVYVVFHANFFLNMKAIQYVWTKETTIGTSMASPYTKNVKLLVLESGESEEWKHERRNLREDYRKLFGKELEADVEAVSFMSDADSTDSTSQAGLKDLTLGYIGGDEEYLVSEPAKEQRRIQIPHLPRIPLFERDEKQRREPSNI